MSDTGSIPDEDFEEVNEDGTLSDVDDAADEIGTISAASKDEAEVSIQSDPLSRPHSGRRGGSGISKSQATRIERETTIT